MVSNVICTRCLQPVTHKTWNQNVEALSALFGGTFGDLRGACSSTIKCQCCQYEMTTHLVCPKCGRNDLQPILKEDFDQRRKEGSGIATHHCGECDSFFKKKHI